MARTKKTSRGGGYGFGGSVLGNSGGSNAGNAMWNSDTSKDCGVMANRGGNNTLAGGRRYKRRGGVGAVDDAIFALGTTYVAKRFAKKGGRRSRRRHRGGTLALQQPRAGYTFNGSGSAGLANAVPVAPNTTNV